MPQVFPLFDRALPYRQDELLLTQGRLGSWEEEGMADLCRGVMRVPCFWNNGEPFTCLTPYVKNLIDMALFRIEYQVRTRHYSRIFYTTDLLSPNTFTTRQDVGKDVQAYIVSQILKLDENRGRNEILVESLTFDGILNVYPGYLGYFEETGGVLVTIPCYKKDGTSYNRLEDIKSHIDGALLRIKSLLDSGRYREAIWHGNKPVDGRLCYVPQDMKNYIVTGLLNIGKRTSPDCSYQGWWYGH